MLVFSLPFCLLLPDGDYCIRLNERDIIKLSLTKVTSRIFDERLPYRGFLKGELETISKLKLWDHKNGNSQWVEVNDLKKISEIRYVIEYITKDDRRIIPQATPSAIENDVDLFDDVKDNFSNNQDELEVNDQLPLHMLSEGRQLIINGEISKDRYGRFRYTRIRYWSGNPAHYQDEFKKAIKSINLLISKYRIHTASYWITNVTEQEFFIYKSMSDASSSSLLTKGISQTQADYEEGLVERVRKSLVTNEPDIPYFQLRLDAMNAMEEANYHLAVINSITALESLIKFYLSSTLTKPGVKDEALRLRLHDQVTVILRIIFNSVEYDGLLNGITNAIRLRNKVIHEAQLNVSKEQAQEVLKVVEEYCHFISCRINK